MKQLILILAITTLISCKGKQEVVKTPELVETYLWTIVLSNGKQEPATKMTQTKYIFLTNSNDRNALCD